jgi:hypothetical protein
VVDDVAAGQTATAGCHAFMVRGRVFGCIIKCPVQEDGKPPKHGKTRNGIFSRTRRRKGKTVRLMLAENRATTSP